MFEYKKIKKQSFLKRLYSGTEEASGTLYKTKINNNEFYLIVEKSGGLYRVSEFFTGQLLRVAEQYRTQQTAIEQICKKLEELDAKTIAWLKEKSKQQQINKIGN